MIRICKVCKIEFNKKGNGTHERKYCSRLCYGQAPRSSLQIEAAVKSGLGNRGRVRTEAMKLKLSIAKTGTKHSPETKLLMSLARRGIKKTAEWKSKIGLAHRGKIVQESTRQKLRALWLGKPRLYYRGANCHLWKGGITPVNFSIRNSLEYKNWRRLVFERDGYRCLDCGVKNGDGKNVVLNADHILPFAYFPRLRFDINNGQTLCRPCHKKTLTYGSKAKNYQLTN